MKESNYTMNDLYIGDHSGFLQYMQVNDQNGWLHK